MLLERYYDDSLAQASYLIGCEQTREAVVIDPNRDTQRYVSAANKRRMRITYVTETHIHADYVSGSRDLARDKRATLLLSGHGGADWSYTYGAADGARLVHDGDVIDVGKVRLRVMHTPGHTPEHLVFVVTDTAIGEAPTGMISGDFLFVGDVGRPDLLEKAAKVAGSMDGAARQLFASLRRLKELPDYVQVWPGHGAGSACGKSLGALPQTTLGYERLYNPALQLTTEEAFVRWVLADQPEPPPYFAVMKRMNRDGPPPLPTDAGRGFTDAAGLQACLDQGIPVVDLRSSADFAREHIPGTINIPDSTSLVTYAGTVLDYDRPILLICSEGQAVSAPPRLALIGLDQIGIASRGVLDEFRSAGHLASAKVIDAQTLASTLDRDGVRVIDVRGRSEWNEEHLAQATHIYLGELRERAAAMDRNDSIVVHCQSGTRSSIAASLLMAQGFTNVANFAGGVDAWRKAGLPLVENTT